MLRRIPLRGAASLAAVAVLLLLVLTGCASAEDNPQTTIDPAGAAGEVIQEIYALIWWLAVVVFILVEGALLYVIFKFRGGARKINGRPVPVHGNTRLEIIWTVIPAIILVIIAVPTLQGIATLNEDQEDALQVTVIANQFFWQFEYPEILDANGEPLLVSGEMHIPIDQRVELTITSNDVIHSFWVPRLHGKLDAIPGNENHMWLEADMVDTFEGQCAEFCGLAHALMRFTVVSHEQADFDAWTQERTASGGGEGGDDLAAQGQEIVESTCAACHTVAGTSAAGTVGPELTGFASHPQIAGVLENTPENLHEWLEDPPAVKPGTGMPNLGLTEQQIEALTAYLYTLE